MLAVYNDENVDTIDCESDIDSIKCTLREWWKCNGPEKYTGYREMVCLKRDIMPKRIGYWQKFVNAGWKIYRQKSVVVRAARWKTSV